MGRAGSAGFGKAVEVLDTISSSVTSLNTNSGFSSGMATKGNKISILAFEVANTIVKGANLLHSLSEENTKNLKDVALPSEAIQNLVSEDMDELLRIAAADKRFIDELNFKYVILMGWFQWILKFDFEAEMKFKKKNFC